MGGSIARTRDKFGSVSADPVQVKRNVLLGVALALIVAGAAAALVGSPTAGANAQPCGAGANGSQGYAYAGHQATRISHGIRATITPTAAAPGRRRVDPGYADDGLCRDHSRRAGSRVRSARAERPGR